ncbi:MAG: hypothetical protein KDD82_23570 [Planctomycetes bacterium]|nr:hypothetical protein [Planctomycetota bacterium]
MKKTLLLGAAALTTCGTLFCLPADGDPIADVLPTLDSQVSYENEFATYQDKAPFVKSIKWDHPLIKAAGAAFGMIDGAQTGVVKEGGAVVREAMDSSSAEVTKVGAGETIKIVRPVGNYYAVNVGGQEGYVSIRDVTPNVGGSRSAMSYGDHLSIYRGDRQNDWGGRSGYYEFLSEFRDAESAKRQIENDRREVEGKHKAGAVAELLKRDCAQCHSGSQQSFSFEVGDKDEDILDEASSYATTWGDDDAKKQSAILRKAVGDSGHVAKLTEGSADFELLTAWVLAGAPDDTLTDYRYGKEIEELDEKLAQIEEADALGEEGRAAKLDQTDLMVARGNYENFIKTLMGEFRDYPFMIKTKLEIMGEHTPVNKPGEQFDPADQAFLFDGLSGDGYNRLKTIMRSVYGDRQDAMNPNPSRFNYAWNQVTSSCHRVDNSVPAWTHAEMRYIYKVWLQDPHHVAKAGETLQSIASDYNVDLNVLKEINADVTSVTAGTKIDLPFRRQYDYEEYEAGLKKFIETQCDPSPTGPDLGYSYDFRGHKNWKANWMECNAFIWASRDAARVLMAQQRKKLPADISYYQRPFASRHMSTKKLMGAYLFYADKDHVHMRKASESGGGPHLYVDADSTPTKSFTVDNKLVDGDSADRNGDGIADYRLFPNVQGSGDQGLESQALPSKQVFAQAPETGAMATHDPTAFMNTPDWGFNKATTVNGSTRAKLAVNGVFDSSDSDEEATFKMRMSRVNQALDRHTNWGPTAMFSPEGFRVRLIEGQKVRGAYSPVVAMSYDISASHSFAAGNYPVTHPKDRGVVKWMFIVKFRTENYYDERNLKAGEEIHWDDDYLNESSLSNDWYTEHALDKFGWIPARDMHTAAYMAEATRSSGGFFGGGTSGGANFGLIDALGNPK